MIDKEAFDAWRDNLVTQEVFRVLAGLRERCQEAWLEASWNKGNNSPELLADLRARAEAVDQLINITFEQYEKENDDSE